jgi:hypothetical protein
VTARRINRIRTTVAPIYVGNPQRASWSAGWAHLFYLALFVAVLVAVVLAVQR